MKWQQLSALHGQNTHDTRQDNVQIFEEVPLPQVNKHTNAKFKMKMSRREKRK